jgi:hypothetical protein
MQGRNLLAVGLGSIKIFIFNSHSKILALAGIKQG